MNADQLRESYQQFFEERGHARIASAPLQPENDPTVLFTTAGMHPLVPFLLGEPHPSGKRLVNFQKCIRTNDIDEVGDTSHLTFFEMLGNWSLGDYFKQESLPWSYEFLTRVLGLDSRRLAVTVFAGDSDAPRDDESADIWRRLGLPEERIHFLPKSDNWWGPAGKTGPCGPDSEMFYDTGKPDHPGCHPGCTCGKWFEVWNNVFMEYNKTADGRYERLAQRNVDTGMGVERTLAGIHDLDDVFRIGTIYPLVEQIEQLSSRAYAENPLPFRVIVDHLRAATFAIADGVQPSNVEAGYVVRRMIRRAVRHGRDLGIREHFCAPFSKAVVDLFAHTYPELERNREIIAEALEREETRFKRTLERGLHQYNKVVDRLKERGKTRFPVPKPLTCLKPLASHFRLPPKWRGNRDCRWMKPVLKNTIPPTGKLLGRRWRKSSRAGLPTTPKKLLACIPPLTCSTRRCVWCWGLACARWDRTSPPNACVLTLLTLRSSHLNSSRRLKKSSTNRFNRTYPYKWKSDPWMKP
jgi:alanyl-tRNA synthetase